MAERSYLYPPKLKLAASSNWLFAPHIESSIWIARPSEEIWNYITDFSNDTQWRNGVTDAQWVSDPPYGVGSTGLHIVEGIGDWPWKITAWEEPHNVRWVVTGGRFEGGHAGYSVASEDVGSRVTLHVRAKRPSLMRILMFIMKRSMKRHCVSKVFQNFNCKCTHLLYKYLIKGMCSMALMIVRLQVADYEAWKNAFDEVEEVRREYGWKKHELFRDSANPNTAVVVGHMENLDRARQYLADERVRAAVARSGVQGPPEAWFLNEVEEKDY